MKKLEYKKENLRLLAFIISKATSGTLSTKLLKDGGWTPESTASQEWQLSKKSKEEYIFEQLMIVAEQGRFDVLDYLVDKTLRKDGIYFKRGNREYVFPAQQFAELKKKMRLEEPVQKKALKLFDERKLHSSVVFAGRHLFSGGHYSQAIFEVCKLLNKRVQELSGVALDGKKLMLDVFSVNQPKLRLNDNNSQSDKDEQEGFMHIFAGVMHGIRNPKGHEIINITDPVRALEYLSLLSLLFRKLSELK